jgi:hypothetical protein
MAYHDYIFNTKGTIVFDPPDVTNKHEKQSSWKKVAMVIINNPDFCSYYSWFVKKRYNLELFKPLRGMHFTVINDEVKLPEQLIKYNEGKLKHNRTTINIEYGIDVRTDDISWWVGARSTDAEQIRLECGLPVKPYWGFHITIGRVDGDWRIENSKYIHNLIKNYGGDYL